MRVRDIKDVIEDLRKILVAKFPTTRKDVLANLAIVSEAARSIEFAEFHINRLENLPEGEKAKLVRDSLIWVHMGHIQIADRIVRHMADVYGVRNEE